MTSMLVPAASARRRARICLVIALMTYGALTVIAGYQQRTGADMAAGWLTFGAALILFLLPFLPWGMRARLHDQRYLTARTLSGRRTVDLLMLVDVDGVRLMVDNPEVDRATKLALPGRAVQVSRSAGDRLGLVEAPFKLRFWWFMRRLAAAFSLLPLWVGTLFLASLV